MTNLVKEILRRSSSLDDLVTLLAELSGRSSAAVQDEIVAHLGARIAFLLLGEISDAPNYAAIESRVARRYRADLASVRDLAAQLAQTAAWVNAAEVSRKTSLRDLPYPLRQRLFISQGNRCGVCGWCFADSPSPWRILEECQATLDHRMPFRLGGDRLENLWILCGLCNAIKESKSHIGEHGRVWMNNHVYYDGQRPVAFWTMRRDLGCTRCGRGPEAVHLKVVRRNVTGAWVVDNCATVCGEHVEAGDPIDY